MRAQEPGCVDTFADIGHDLLMQPDIIGQYGVQASHDLRGWVRVFGNSDAAVPFNEPFTNVRAQCGWQKTPDHGKNTGVALPVQDAVQDFATAGAAGYVGSTKIDSGVSLDAKKVTNQYHDALGRVTHELEGQDQEVFCGKVRLELCQLIRVPAVVQIVHLATLV